MSDQRYLNEADANRIEQIIEATPEDVFAAWVTPATIEMWWGPEGFTTIVKQMELVEGGRFVFRMIAPDGASCDMTGCYKRIQPPYCLVFEITAHCTLGLPPGIEPHGGQSLVTVRFSEIGHSTRVVVTHALLAPAYGQLAAMSWSGALRKLAANLTSPIGDR